MYNIVILNTYYGQHWMFNVLVVKYYDFNFYDIG